MPRWLTQLVPGFSLPTLLCLGKMPLARGMAAYVWDGYGAFRQPKFECGCCEIVIFRVCGVRQNFYVFSLYRNHELDDRIFFKFECPSSGVAGFYHHELSWSCNFWLRNCLRLRSVGGLSPVANRLKWLHSSLSAVISMAQACAWAILVPNLCVSKKVFLKHQVNWITVSGAIEDFSWRTICLADNSVKVLNEHLSLLVRRYVPTKVIRVRNKDKPWFDDQCRHDFSLKRKAHLRWTRDRSRVNWEEFVRCQVRANETYSGGQASVNWQKQGCSYECPVPS